MCYEIALHVSLDRRANDSVVIPVHVVAIDEQTAPDGEDEHKKQKFLHKKSLSQMAINRELEYLESLRTIYKCALGDKWKGGRKIRRICREKLGDIECAVLKKEWECERCA